MITIIVIGHLIAGIIGAWLGYKFGLLDATTGPNWIKIDSLTVTGERALVGPTSGTLIMEPSKHTYFKTKKH